MSTPSYFRPIFGRGKTSLITVPALDDGDTTIQLGTGHGFYSVGDHIFLSKTDNSVPQYLGPALTKSVSGPNGSITVPLAVSRGFSNDLGRVWKPTKFWRPVYGTDANHTKERDSGVRTRMTIGALPTATQVADASEALRMRFSPTLPADLANWEVFLFTDMLGGLKSFAVAWFDQMLARTRVVQVKKRMGDDTWVTADRGTHSSFSATFLIEEEDEFPDPL